MRKTWNVALSGVTDGNTLNDVKVPMRVLVGDISGDGVVNASDLSQVNAQVGAPLSGSDFRNDVNINRAINGSDVSFVKSKSGTALPSAAPSIQKR